MKSIIIKITVTPDECRSDYPCIACDIIPGREDEIIHHVKGACLHALGEFENIPNEIRFEISESFYKDY
jgi:hypothetical protein